MKKNAIYLFLVLMGGFYSTVSAQKWLTDVYHDDYYGAGVYLGYINQQMKLSSNGMSVMTDGTWGNIDKRLHGFSVGAVYQNNWGYGIGIHSGITIEGYISFNDPPTPSPYSEYNSVKDCYDSYMEFAFQVPLHLALTVPITSVLAVGTHTGLGMTLSYIGLFSDSRGYFDDFNLLGKGVNVFNLTYDFALYVELENCRLEAQWSTGIVKQPLENDSFDQAKRNKFGIALTVFLE